MFNKKYKMALTVIDDMVQYYEEQYAWWTKRYMELEADDPSYDTFRNEAMDFKRLANVLKGAKRNIRIANNEEKP